MARSPSPLPQVGHRPRLVALRLLPQATQTAYTVWQDSFQTAATGHGVVLPSDPTSCPTTNGAWLYSDVTKAQAHATCHIKLTHEFLS